MSKQLVPVDLIAPGAFGLNTEKAKSVLDPRWATDAHNAVRDTEGRLAARKGYNVLTTTPVSPAEEIKTLFEYRTGAGLSTVLVAWDGGIADDISDPEGNDISGAVTDANGRWHMHNFNNKVIGFQPGLQPIVWTGTGNFATVSSASGSAPDGGIGWCGYGRVWCVDGDGQTIQYSALLDETHWTTGAGLIDMRNVWTDGTDQVMGIAGFNGALVVFGKRHIVFWVDGQGSALGLDPNNIYVSDVITGVGLLSALTVKPYGESDLLFVSQHGVQTLQRLLVQKSNPVAALTKNVRRTFVSDALAESPALLRAEFDQENNLYVVSMPTMGRSWVLGPRFTDEEGDEVAVITTWSLVPTSMLYVAGTMYLGLSTGEIAEYTGDSDDGEEFTFRWTSPWLDLGEDFANFLKILKRVGGIIFARSGTTINFKWWIDFNEVANVLQETITGDAGDEWGVMEWGEFEWSGGLSLRQFKLPARGTGQYFRLGVEAAITGVFAIQQSELFAKVGRLA